MKSKYFDIGVNLTHPSLFKDLENILRKSFESGVDKLSITGTDLEESIKAIEICEQSSFDLICTSGIHPHQAKTFNNETFSEIKKLFKNDKVKALGETGLDFHRNYSTPDQQQISFEAHLEFSIEEKIPLFLHVRDSHKKFMEMVKPISDKLPEKVIHCFTGTKDELFDYLNMDFYIGITGWVLDERRGFHLKELINEIPLNRLMIETDAPYLIPRIPELKNKRTNKPEYLPIICKEICRNRKEHEDEVIDSMYMNSMNFFRLES